MKPAGRNHGSKVNGDVMKVGSTKGGLNLNVVTEKEEEKVQLEEKKALWLHRQDRLGTCVTA